MKISKLFHWLYCAVMFLPLFCLPVYALAVRSDNNYQPISIDTSGYQYVDKFTTNDIQNDHTYVNGNIYSLDLTFNSQSLTSYFSSYDFLYFTFIHFEYNDELYYFISDTTEQLYLSYNGYFYIGSDRDSSSIRVLSSTVDIVTNWHDIGQDLYECGVKLNSSDFNIVEREFVSGITYNDTDFGSQTIYTLYKEVDTYFNYDDVLSIGELYDWCEINLFNGNATLGFFIFFHLLEYWLLTSLLWLIFDILMYVPQLCHRWLDKASLE